MIDLSKSQLFSLDGTVIQTQPGESAVPPLAPRSINNGAIVDQKYEIIGLLGEGGMGTVYKARHLSLAKEVALKTLRSTHMHDTAWQRFQREAQSIAKLSHKNIIQVFDFGVAENNMPFYTMECLEGETLMDRLRRGGPIKVKEAAEIFLQVCSGLAEAHKKGIIHRDLKPGNIFLAQSAGGGGTVLVKVVDFGLANLASHSLDGQKLTSSGTIFGSPLYMSPEQSLGLDLKPATDIYSCGCALFETLTGRPPYRGETAFATMLAHQNDTIPSINENDRNLHFSQRLDGLLKRMMIKDDAARLQSMIEVESELRLVLEAAVSTTRAAPQSETSSKRPKESGNEDKRKVALPVALALTFVLAVSGVTLVKKGQSPAEQNKSRAVITPQPEQKQPQVAPYLQRPGTKWTTDRTFVFPQNTNLGKIILHKIVIKDGKPFDMSKECEAANTIRVPAQTLVELQANLEVAEKPWLLGGFGPHDLATLRLPREYPFNEQHLHYVSKMTDLNTLDMGDCDLTPEIIYCLNQLPQLQVLAMKHTNLTGEDFARLRYLPHLTGLWATSTQKFSPAIDRIKNSTSITYLEINECDLTDKDMQTIATIPNLDYLNVSHNQAIGDRGVAAISKLKKLKSLHLQQTGVTPKCIESLKQLPQLTNLSVDSDLWPDVYQRKLRNELPHCNFTPRKEEKSEAIIDEIKKRPRGIEGF